MKKNDIAALIIGIVSLAFVVFLVFSTVQKAKIESTEEPCTPGSCGTEIEINAK